MKIVVLDGETLNPGDLSWSGFEKICETEVYARTEKEEIVNRIGSAEIVITNKTAITKEVLENCPNIKYIGTLATGYNVIDTVSAREKNIPVCNIPSYSTASVVQFTIGLLIEMCSRIGLHSRSVADGEWEKCKNFSYWKTPLIELDGKTIGIIGLGEIGRGVARAAKALGMKVIAYSRTQRDVGRLLAEYVSFNELLERSDVISLHCPLFPQTEGMINKETIGKMKDGVMLINTSRGGVIVEKDVADALNSGKIYSAAVDVVSAEPILPDNPLLKAKNCIITPHIAWAPLEARQRLIKIAVQNVKAFLNGLPENVVN